MEIKLKYQPLDLSRGIKEKDFDNYLIQPRNVTIAKAVAISPLEDVMKKRNKEKFNFDDFKVTRKLVKKTTTSWEKVFNSVLKFLEIRSDDSRVYDMDGLKYFEGLGYCILTSDLKDYIDSQEDHYTNTSEYPQLFWPKAKRDEIFPTKLFLPERNYSRINNENANIVLNAKRFCSGLEKHVSKAFKEANKEWFEEETGYSMKNLPKRDDDAIKRTREIARGKYVFINLVREETPEYKEAIGFLLSEIQDLENNVPLEGYKVRQENKDKTYVNIKNVFDRLSNERLAKDKLIKIAGRYEIFP